MVWRTKMWSLLQQREKLYKCQSAVELSILMLQHFHSTGRAFLISMPSGTGKSIKINRCVIQVTIAYHWNTLHVVHMTTFFDSAFHHKIYEIIFNTSLINRLELSTSSSFILQLSTLPKQVLATSTQGFTVQELPVHDICSTTEIWPLWVLRAICSSAGSNLISGESLSYCHPAHHYVAAGDLEMPKKHMPFFSQTTALC